MSPSRSGCASPFGRSLFGGRDNDSMMGSTGRDTMAGDLGDDTLSGGNDGDVFVVGPGAGRDTILDFSFSAGDRIGCLPGVGLSSISHVGSATILGLGDVTITLLGLPGANVTSAWFIPL